MSWTDLWEVVRADMPDNWNLRADGLLAVRVEFCLIFYLVSTAKFICLGVGCGSSKADTLLFLLCLLWEWEPSEEG